MISRRTAITSALAATYSPLAWGADPIKLGTSAPLTGGLAPNGRAYLLTIQIFIEDINAAGGINGRPLQLVYYDDQSNPANVPPLYTKLLDVDKVDLVCGQGTNDVTPAMPIVMEHGYVMMAMFALAVNDKFRYPRYFQTMPYGPDGGEAISAGFFDNAMKLDPKPKTVALVGADAEFSKTAVAGARAQAKKLGLKIVYDRTYPPNTVDYGPIIRAIAASSPELLYIGSYPIDSVGLIRSARELRFAPKMFGGGMVGTQATSLKSELGDLLNDVVSYELYTPAAAKFWPDVDKLLARYQPRAAPAGVDAQGFYIPPFTYCSLEILAQTVAKVGLDQDKMAQYMHANTFKTIVGDIKFGESGEWAEPRMLTVQFRGVKGQGIEQFKDPGTEIILDPPAYRTGTLQAPFGV
jgi:branched-chain amino acid transport system substrate-binding protein